METQNTLRTCERKQVFSENKIQANDICGSKYLPSTDQITDFTVKGSRKKGIFLVARPLRPYPLPSSLVATIFFGFFLSPQIIPLPPPLLLVVGPLKKKYFFAAFLR